MNYIFKKSTSNVYLSVVNYCKPSMALLDTAYKKSAHIWQDKELALRWYGNMKKRNMLPIGEYEIIELQ